MLNKKKKVALITDTIIAKEYQSLLDKLSFKSLVIPAGEIHKTRQTKQWIEDALLEDHFGKDSFLIGLGGGTVMDITGFVASTFCRGISFIVIPTTLLGMVDACLGGKTAVNTAHGKNLIGSFYFPSSILIDFNFLDTLPAKQLLNGMAEMIKYGLIRSKPLFEKLESGSVIKELIQDCLEIKKEIVESDPYEEKGIRRILNFGHTFGHALELLENYQIEHGQAVGMGMILESWVSQRLGFLSQEEFKRIDQICQRFMLSHTPMISEVIAALSRDKKAVQRVPRFVVLKKIGEVVPFDGEYCTSIDLKLIEEALQLL